MQHNEIKALLDERYHQYNTPEFIAPDPVSIPHRYSDKEDIEIAGLLTAIISWGRRDLILRSATQMMERMDDAPYEFVMQATEAEIDALSDFVYRTFQGTDCCFIVRGLRHVYRDLGGMEEVMRLPESATDTSTAIMALRSAISSVPDFPSRTFKHLSNPGTGSAAKRLNMFLRWMVRRDRRGVDFGIWEGIRTEQLICPLDVHTGNVGRKLGLLKRKQNDWKSALELTEALRKFDPVDPVKYDFSLFGLGIYEKF